MSYLDFCRNMTQFIENCPSMFHSVASIEKELKAKNYTLLKEKEVWNIEPGHGYYVIRNNSSICAFFVPETIEDYHFQISGGFYQAHCNGALWRRWGSHQSAKALPDICRYD